MGSRQDVLASPANAAGLRPVMAGGKRAGRRAVVSWMLAFVAGLTLAKLLLYVLAAQPFGGAEPGLCQWDCEWYIHTIQHGYDPEPQFRPGTDFANWAFFPLYPLLARLLKLVTGVGAFWAGTAVSVLCFIGFALLSLRYRALTRGPEAGDLTWIVLLMVYPFSIYFLIPYTESLYLLLTVLLLLAMQTRKPTGAGLATGLLTAARPTGVLAIPYLAAERLWHARLAFRPGLASGERIRVLADCAFPLALAPLGIALYMAYLYWLTGDALAFSHVQVVWGKGFGGNPIKSFYWSLAKNDWLKMLDFQAAPSQSYCASFAFVGGFACLWLLWRQRLLEAWLLGTTVLLGAVTGVESMPRFVTTNPVFLLVVGDVVDRVRSRGARIGLAVAAVLLQALLLRTWFGNSAVLM